MVSLGLILDVAVSPRVHYQACAKPDADSVCPIGALVSPWICQHCCLIYPLTLLNFAAEQSLYGQNDLDLVLDVDRYFLQGS